MTDSLERLMTDVVRRYVPLGELTDRLQDIRAESYGMEIIADQDHHPVSRLLDTMMLQVRSSHICRDDLVGWIQDIYVTQKILEKITDAALIAVGTPLTPAFSG